MMNNLALVIDSTFKYSDAWPIYFGQLNKFFPREIKKYLFTDHVDKEYTDNMDVVTYDNNDSYRNQFLNCLKQVNEEYIIYNSEDYVLYDRVNVEEIEMVISVLNNDQSYDFVKFIRGPEFTYPYSISYPFLNSIDRADNNFFAQQASLWRTKSLIKVFEASNYSNGRMQQEPGGSAICRKLGIGGLQYFTGKEYKRGKYHYDSLIYPCIATAIVKGRWNTLEYKEYLEPMFAEYGIDKSIRGEYAGY